MSMSHTRADQTLNAVLRDTATPHVLLHTADPGADGTANVAVQPDGTTPIVRKAASFDAPSNHPDNVERRVLSSAAVAWDGTEINSNQTISHFSVWSAATAGQVEFIAALAESKITGSDGARFDAGDLEHALGVFAKPA